MDESRYASAPLSPAESAVRQSLKAYDGAYGTRIMTARNSVTGANSNISDGNCYGG
jgi:hypothetical protein